jgi:transmembrane sensor
MTEREPPRQIGADEPSPEALARVLAGEGSDEEALAVRKWSDSDPEHASAVRMLSTAMDGLSRTPPAIDVERALARVHARLAEDVKVRPIRRMRWSVWAGLAAAATIALAVTGYFMRPQIAALRALVPGGNLNRVRDYATFENTRELRLSDGTRVFMGPNSGVQIPDNYNRGSRTIQADGIVRFDVVHNPYVPFAVHVGPAVIRDVGTQFVVRSFRDPLPGMHNPDAAMVSRVVVSVLEGSVQLSGGGLAASGAPVYLAAGSRGMASMKLEAERLPGSVSVSDTAWMHGELVFDATPLSDVVAEVKRFYGTPVVVDDSTLAARRLTATFSTKDPVDRVLSAIALAMDARIEHQSRTTVLSPTVAH